MVSGPGCRPVGYAVGMMHQLIAAVLIALTPPDGEGTKWPLTSDVPRDVAKPEETALGRYVAKDDGAYRWELVKTTESEGVTIYDIRLTSQRWRSESEVSHPLWTHWLTVSVPTKIRHETAIMMVGGGRRREEPQPTPRAEFLLLARSSGAVMCVVDNVPNQPLQLEGDGQERTEDDMLSQTWNLAMRDDDSLWIGRFPMVKAVKRAMDATDEFLGSKGIRNDGYFVTGASKRGWTAWLIGAMDARVKAIAPIVIDVLNMPANTRHHYEAYGFWSEALNDYIKNGIAAKFGSPELARVTAHEDPAEYVKFLGERPVYIVNATGDEFFPTDSFRHYERLLDCDWGLRCVPNAGHNLKGSNALLDIVAFYNAFVTGAERPKVRWTVGETGVVAITTSAKPVRAVVWASDNAKSRDFRFHFTGATWMQKELPATNTEGTTYEMKLEKPATGFRAALAEFTFAPPSPGAPPLVYTTRVFVMPEEMPFALPAASPAKP